jgi:O-antigen/teichoic acid export membrane protein
LSDGVAHVRSRPGALDRRPNDLISLAKGGSFLVGGGFVEFVFRLGIAWILARALGASGYGLYTLVVGIAGLVVGIGALGLDDAMVRYIAIQSGRKDRAGLRGTLQVGVVGALVVGVVAGFSLFLVAGWLAGDVFDEPELLPLIRVISGVVPFLLLSNVLLGVTRGFNRMDYAALAENVVQSVVRFALVAILWLINLDVLVAIIAFGLADIAATLLLIFFVRKLVVATGPPEPARRDLRPIFGFALPLWLSGLLNRFRNNVETFVLGALSIAADVGVFAVAAKVNFISHTVYRAVIVAVKPLLARGFADGDRPGLARVYSATTRWTFTLNLPFFLVTVLYAREVLSVFGPEFVVGASAFVILAFSELFVAATGTCGSMIDMAGHMRVKVFNSVLWIVSAVTLSILLIPALGVVGAALASTISVTLVNLVRVIEVWILDRLHPYRTDFWKPIAAGVVAGLWGLGLRLLGSGSFWLAAGQGLTVVAVYAGLLALFGIHDDDRVILGRIRDKVANKVRVGGDRR